MDQTTCQDQQPPVVVTPSGRLNLKRGGGHYRPTRKDALIQLGRLAYQKEEERQLPPPEPVVEITPAVISAKPASVVSGLPYIEVPPKRKAPKVEKVEENDEEEVVFLLAMM